MPGLELLKLQPFQELLVLRRIHRIRAQMIPFLELLELSLFIHVWCGDRGRFGGFFIGTRFQCQRRFSLFVREHTGAGHRLAGIIGFPIALKLNVRAHWPKTEVAKRLEKEEAKKREQRGRAGCLWQSLQAARRLLETGEREAEIVRDVMMKGLEVADKVDYAEIRSVPDLEPMTLIDGRTLLAIAARIGPARLIDNLVMQVSQARALTGSLIGEEEKS